MSNKDLILLGIMLVMLVGGPALFIAFGSLYIEYGEGTVIDPGRGKTRSQKGGVPEGGTFYEWVEKAEGVKREQGQAKRAEAAPSPASEERVLGAYYPEDYKQPEGSGIDPLLVAVVGGAVVFGGVGAGLFLLLRPKDPDPLPESEDPEAPSASEPPPVSDELIAHESLAVAGDELHQGEGQ